MVRKASLLSFAQQSKTSRNGSAVNAIIFSRSQCVSDGHTGNEFLSSLHTEFLNDFNAAPFRLSTFVTNSFIPPYIRAEFSNDFNAAPFRNQHSKRIRSSLHTYVWKSVITFPTHSCSLDGFCHPFIHVRCVIHELSTAPFTVPPRRIPRWTSFGCVLTSTNFIQSFITSGTNFLDHFTTRVNPYPVYLNSRCVLLQ